MHTHCSDLFSFPVELSLRSNVGRSIINGKPTD